MIKPFVFLFRAYSNKHRRFFADGFKILYFNPIQSRYLLRNAFPFEPLCIIRSAVF